MRKAQAAIRDERAKQGLCADDIRQPSSDKRPFVVAAVRTVPLSETGPTRVPLVEHRALQEGTTETPNRGTFRWPLSGMTVTTRFVGRPR
jgi:hypothetical protein